MDELKKLPDGKYILRRKDGSKRVITINNKPSMADQQWKDDCDTNKIIEKYRRTGQLTHVARIQGKFEDVSDVQDLHKSMIIVQKANDDFLKLSSEVRKRFNNSVTQMVEFLRDPKNIDEAIRLGLMSRKNFSDVSKKENSDVGNTKKAKQPSGDSESDSGPTKKTDSSN